MGRGLAAGLTTAALAAALVVAVPAPAQAATCTGYQAPQPTCTPPTVVSASSSASVVAIRAGLDTTVTITARFSDPDDILGGVTFDSDQNEQSLPATTYYPTSVSGDVKTYSRTYTERAAERTGTRKVTITAGLRDDVQASGFTGLTRTVSYAVTHAPRLVMSRASLRTTKKVKFTGYLTGTPGNDNTGRPVAVQFKAKGKKKFKTKQKVTTSASNGAFSTKKFKLRKTGKWRAVFAGAPAVLPARSAVVKVAKGSSSASTPRDRIRDRRTGDPRDRRRR